MQSSPFYVVVWELVILVSRLLARKLWGWLPKQRRESRGCPATTMRARKRKKIAQETRRFGKYLLTPEDARLAQAQRRRKWCERQRKKVSGSSSGGDKKSDNGAGGGAYLEELIRVKFHARQLGMTPKKISLEGLIFTAAEDARKICGKWADGGVERRCRKKNKAGGWEKHEVGVSNRRNDDDCLARSLCPRQQQLRRRRQQQHTQTDTPTPSVPACFFSQRAWPCARHAPAGGRAATMTPAAVALTARRGERRPAHETEPVNQSAESSPQLPAPLLLHLSSKHHHPSLPLSFFVPSPLFPLFTVAVALCFFASLFMCVAHSARWLRNNLCRSPLSLVPSIFGSSSRVPTSCRIVHDKGELVIECRQTADCCSPIPSCSSLFRICRLVPVARQPASRDCRRFTCLPSSSA